ncbi:hypothetical protein DF150_07385 [Burkholderia cenocepacia]|nr:hypothetical protein DF150_07385 [Burkholderia cenocepacia]
MRAFSFASFVVPACGQCDGGAEEAACAACGGTRRDARVRVSAACGMQASLVRSAKQTTVPASCGHCRLCIRAFGFAPAGGCVKKPVSRAGFFISRVPLSHPARARYVCVFSRPTPYVVISDVLSNFPVTHARFLP